MTTRPHNVRSPTSGARETPLRGTGYNCPNAGLKSCSFPVAGFLTRLKSYFAQLAVRLLVFIVFIVTPHFSISDPNIPDDRQVKDPAAQEKKTQTHND